MSYIPKNLAFKFEELQNFSREKITIQPSNGNAVVNAGQTIIVDLPYSSLVALDTFEMYADFQSTAGTDDAVINEILYPPRNSASFIDELEIRFNSQVVQTIQNYSLLHNKLSDYTCSEDSLKKRQINGENADPFTRTNVDANGIQTAISRGLPHSTATTVYEDRIAKRTICIRSLLGFLSSSSTPELDTGLIGNIQLRFKLSGSHILVKSNGVLNGAVTAPGGTAANKTYQLSNVQFKIIRYQMPSAYYEALSSKLSSENKLTIVFDDYQSYYGPSLANSKTQQLRFTTANKSIKWLMGTFLLSDYQTIDALVCDNPRTDRSIIKRISENEIQLLCNAKAFYTTGCGLKTSQWQVGSQYLPQVPSNQLECFNNMCQTFNITNDASVGVSPFIQSLAGYVDGNFADFLPLCYIGEDVKLISGLNTKDLPLSITWSTVGGTTDQTVIPIVFVCSDRRIHIMPNQQIEID